MVYLVATDAAGCRQINLPCQSILDGLSGKQVVADASASERLEDSEAWQAHARNMAETCRALSSLRTIGMLQITSVMCEALIHATGRSCCFLTFATWLGKFHPEAALSVALYLLVLFSVLPNVLPCSSQIPVPGNMSHHSVPSRLLLTLYFW